MALQPRIRCLVRSLWVSYCQDSRSSSRPGRWLYQGIIIGILLGTTGSIALLSPANGADNRPIKAMTSASQLSLGRWRLPSPRSRVTISPPSTPEISPAEPPQAPSMIWLVVMPAIPLMGGTLIYVTRLCRGQPPLEGRTVQLLERVSSPSGRNPENGLNEHPEASHKSDLE
jgi:hypothetical protein